MLLIDETEQKKMRECLQNLLQQRQTRNKSYSWRALARDLSIAPSTLSEFMRGKSALSKKTAVTIENYFTTKIKNS